MSHGKTRTGSIGDVRDEKKQMPMHGSGEDQSALHLSAQVGSKFLRLARRLSIPSPIICDVGSRDATEGIFLLKHLQGRELHVFEPNPGALARCRRSVDALAGDPDCKGRVLLNELAVIEEIGEITLNVVDVERSVNKDIGFSSLYQINPRYMRRRGRIAQKPVTVQAVTLDHYFRDRPLPDILWVDVEGAELRVFRGAAKTLGNVKLIHVELSFRPMQLSKPLFWEIDHFLTQHGFEWFAFEEAGFIRSYLMRKRLLPNLPWRINGIYYRA